MQAEGLSASEEMMLAWRGRLCRIFAVRKVPSGRRAVKSLTQEPKELLLHSDESPWADAVVLVFGRHSCPRRRSKHGGVVIHHPVFAFSAAGFSEDMKGCPRNQWG